VKRDGGADPASKPKGKAPPPVPTAAKPKPKAEAEAEAAAPAAKPAAKLSAADEAAAHSKAHQKWILDTLEKHGGACSYAVLVEVGEAHQCDTVGAMLKILKRRKVIDFPGMFLMWPMHRDAVVALKGEAGDRPAKRDLPPRTLSQVKRDSKDAAPKGKAPPPAPAAAAVVHEAKGLFDALEDSDGDEDDGAGGGGGGGGEDAEIARLRRRSNTAEAAALAAEAAALQAERDARDAEKAAIIEPALAKSSSGKGLFDSDSDSSGGGLFD